MCADSVGRMGALLAGLFGVLAGCTPAWVEPELAPSLALPPLPVEQVAATAPAVVRAAGAVHDPLSAYPPGLNVTLTAVDVDVRALLPVLAEAAELSLVMGPEVQGRVTVNLIDVPAIEAMRVVLEEAGLMIAQPTFVVPWEPVVFHALPVNIDTADLDLIRGRFGVSAEMARWIVETRVR